MSAKLFNMLTFTDDELAMLYRIVCSGMLGGKPEVRSALYAKVQVAHEKMRTGTAKKISIEGTATNGTDARAPEASASVRQNDGAIRVSARQAHAKAAERKSQRSRVRPDTN